MLTVTILIGSALTCSTSAIPKMSNLGTGCLWIACVLLLAPSASRATEESKPALLGRTMWSAFECGAFAEDSGERQEAQRLYSFGIEAGRQFLVAVRAGSVTKEELSSSVPVGVTLRLGGASDEFIIGRIFEGALHDAMDRIWYDSDDFTQSRPRSEELRKLAAEVLYRRGNCELVGR